MGRTICLVLSLFLALGHAIPVSGPTNQADLMEKILRAKPEDNDIGSSIQDPQAQIDTSEVDENVPLTNDDFSVDHELPSANEDDVPLVKEETVEVEGQDQDDVKFEPEMIVPEEDEPLQLYPDMSDPVIEEGVHLVIEDPIPEEPVLFEQGDASIAEDQVFPLTDEDVNSFVENEEDFPFSEEQIMVMQEKLAADAYKIQPSSIPDDSETQDMIMENFGFDGEMPAIENPENIKEIIIVGLEETALDQPIAEEPVIPGFVDEVPQPGAEMVYEDDEESMFGSLFPVQLEEQVPQESPYVPEDTEGVVYFGQHDELMPVPEEVFDTPNEYLEPPVDIQIEQMPPVLVIEMPDDPVMNSEESSEEDMPMQPVMDVLEDYFIPGEKMPMSNTQDQPSDISVFPEEGEVFINDDFFTETQGAIDADAHFDDEFVPDERPMLTEMLVRSEDEPVIILKDFNTGYDQTLFGSEDPVEPQNIQDEGEPIMEIIRIDNEEETPELSQYLPLPMIDVESDPTDVRIPVAGMIENEQIAPIAKFPEETPLPIAIDQDSYSFQDYDPQPMIFPAEMPPRRNLPVFPDDWNEKHFFAPSNDGPSPLNGQIPIYYDSHFHGDESESSYYSPLPFQGPSYSPPASHGHSHESPSDSSEMSVPLFGAHPKFPPQFSLTKVFQIMANMENDDVPSQESGIISPPDSPDFNLFDDNEFGMDEDDEHFPFSGQVHFHSEFPDSPRPIENFDSFDIPSPSQMALREHFQGPNTFPWNYRRPYYNPNFLNMDFRQRLTSQNLNSDKFTDKFSSPQQISLGSLSLSTSSSRPTSSNLFSPSQDNLEQIIRNPSDENIDMNPEGPFDVQISVIPFKTGYDEQPNTEFNRFGFRYPQQSSNFNPYMQYPSRYLSYDDYTPYQTGNLYPSQPTYDRFSGNYGYEVPQRNFYPYNIPTPMW